jgi:hypothetical protein
MSYTIHFTTKEERESWATEVPTATQAVVVIAGLRQKGESITLIRSPQEGDMGTEMLLQLAREEAEEMPGYPNVARYGRRARA